MAGSRIKDPYKLKKLIEGFAISDNGMVMSTVKRYIALVNIEKMLEEEIMAGNLEEVNKYYRAASSANNTVTVLAKLVKQFATDDNGAAEILEFINGN